MNASASRQSLLTQLIASTLGLTGLVTLLGYLVNTATEDFFGISMRTPAAEFASIGGEFLLGSANALVDRIGVTVIGALVAVVLLSISRPLFEAANTVTEKREPLLIRTLWQHPRLWLGRTCETVGAFLRRYSAALLVALIFLGKAAYLDAPPRLFSNIILQTPQALNARAQTFASGCPIERWAARVWQQQVVSHEGSQRSHEAHSTLERDYVINIVITALLVIAGLRLAAKGSRVLAILIIFASVLALPHTYATTLRRMRFPAIQIVKPLADLPAGGPTVGTHRLLLLSEDSDRITAYDEADHEVHYIAVSAAEHIKVEDRADLISMHLQERQTP